MPHEPNLPLPGIPSAPTYMPIFTPMLMVSYQRICVRCDDETMAYIPKDIKKYPYLIMGPFCMTCIYVLEQEFLKELTFEQMPEWLGHTWIYPVFEKHFEAKLKALLGRDS